MWCCAILTNLDLDPATFDCVAPRNLSLFGEIILTNLLNVGECRAIYGTNDHIFWRPPPPPH